MESKNEIAVFGGGCFWCTEAIFKNLKGVVSAVPGYAGGKMKNPGYEDVSTGETGYAEVIRIIFNPAVIAYRDLLEVFWHTHNPTVLNRQGNDIGTQYRSIILYTTPGQKKSAEESLEKLRQSKEIKDPIVTEIKKLGDFYEAEDYHKNYYQNHRGDPYCELIISPKLQKLRERYSPLTVA